MSDSSVTSDNRNPADAWLATVATMDRTTALAFLGESARATVASLETLAGAALAEVENDLARADGWLQLASDLRALLTTTNEESDGEES
ncbi:MAG: hypothetical protein KDE58_07150, partial [Caldilineaceae bacterium]|nr:hypothetical protein [Caldilineaceae bacterium]